MASTEGRMASTEGRNADYADLVNPDRIRRSVRRLFSGKAREILAELLQNSQRACAGRVTVTTRPDGFTYQDDGHGLRHGADSFHTLLRMAESDFQNSTADDQDPMGLGIHALLAHESVTRVTFASDGLSLSLDTARWWDEPSYYTTWADRLEVAAPRVPGLRVDVSCDPALVADVCAALRGHGTRGYQTGVARGYAGILDVALDGEPVPTDLPDHVRPARVLFTRVWRGAALTFGTSPGRFDSHVLWYGQVIPTPRLRGGRLLLEVTSGRPVNPRAPSREGLIEDRAWADLTAFVTDEAFAWVAEDPARLSVETVTLLHALDGPRARRELDVYVAEPYAAYACARDCEEMDRTDGAVLVRYEDPGRLAVVGDLCVMEPEETEPTTYSWGLSTALAALPPAHRPVCYDPARVDAARVVWAPEPLPAQPRGMERTRALWVAPGRVGLYRLQAGEPASVAPDRAAVTDWRAAPETVFAFDGTNSYDPRDVVFVVAAPDVRGFIRNNADAAYNPEDSDDGDEEAWNQNARAWARDADGGDILKADWTLDDLRDLLSGGEYSRRPTVTAITLGYDPGNTAPLSLTATLATGETKTVRVERY